MRCPHCKRPGYRPNPTEAFAVNLRALRTKLGLSQRELAERAGIHYSKLNMIERNVRDPQLGECHRLAEALGTSVEALTLEPPDRALPSFKPPT